jgi:hypothetical protein
VIPAVLLVGVGRQRRVPLPAPLFLLWPLVAAAIVGIYTVRGLRRLIGLRPGAPIVPILIGAAFRLSGLKVDIRTRDGTDVLLWFL